MNEEVVPSCDADGTAPDLARNKLVLAMELDSFTRQVHVLELTRKSRLKAVD